MYQCFIILATLSLFPFAKTYAGEPVDLEAVTAIRQEAFGNSQITEIISHLTDVIGPRLSNSPQMTEANNWTKEKMEEWGLNAQVEAWGEFGRGWSFSHCSVHMTAPRKFPLLALPSAWTPGTKGPVSGTVIKLKIESKADMEEWKGKLAGKILLLNDPREIPQADKPLSTRFDDHELAELSEFRIKAPGNNQGNWRKRYMKRRQMRKILPAFLAEEGVVATLASSNFYGGIVRVSGGGSREKGEPYGVPRLVLSAEHYALVARMLEREAEVTLEIDVKAQFHEEDSMGYNTIAEIEGTDKKAEIVMLGGHLDSWHGGTGATDNAAGVAVAMEAVRILKAIGVKPRRTIRVGLWSGEEQGLLGSRGYVNKHLAEREEPKDKEQKDLPRWARKEQGKLILKPEHEHFSAYYNLDNGSGKIRGVYTQQNARVKPIFEAWLEPFHDVGATTVTIRNTGGTDHQAFDGVGLPGFQFIQDELAYDTRTHHSNMDVFDNVVIEDLMQASAVMASFVYHTAMRDEKMPRKAMPKDD